MQSVGFKEWALVCAALGAGRQSVIIRKGGLAEGRDGFAFRHREFFLFPTFFHEQLARVRLSAAVLPQPSPNEIEIRYFARVEEARIMTNWTEVRELQPLHILRESVVRERFDYENIARSACGFRANFSTGTCLAFSRREGVWRVSQLGRIAGAAG